MWKDLIVITLLVVAIGTGLRGMQRHRGVFAEFDWRDVVQFRPDGVLYVLYAFSVAFSLLDGLARTSWLASVGWADTGERWQMIWLVIHGAWALLAIIFHVLTDALLDIPEFRKLCSRPTPNMVSRLWRIARRSWESLTNSRKVGP